MARNVWTSGEWKLLGGMGDDELAARIDRTVSAIKTKRARLKIGCHPSPGAARAWTPGEDARLGTMPDEDKLLGTDFDFIIALRIGRRMHDVAYRRKQLGVGSYRRRGKLSP
jgi:hypothetical protein